MHVGLVVLFGLFVALIKIIFFKYVYFIVIAENQSERWMEKYG
jgi:hypothetical protein